jgi:Do/DeqQ family serine protease
VARFALVLCLAFAAAFASDSDSDSACADERTIPANPAQLHLSFAPIVAKARPSVVNVYASRVEAMPRNPFADDPFFRHFFGDEPQQQHDRVAQSLGSGVIVDASGLVVTNHHVIEGMTEVKVALSDKREYEAEIVLRDKRTDLAVLRLKGADNLAPLELGDSDAIEVGDFVIAIGNPFGVGQSVTQGIVSALARTQVGVNDYGFFIQTDAAINPGNSGGALVDTWGRLVGINSAIYSRSGGSMGIGFAIPVNMVKSVIATAKAGGSVVKRPYLGAKLQDVTKDIADSLGLNRPVGAAVANLERGSPAADAGLKSGDVITAVDGQSVDNAAGVDFRIGVKPLGGTAALSVLRGGKTLTMPVKLKAAPETTPRGDAGRRRRGHRRRRGARHAGGGVRAAERRCGAGGQRRRNPRDQGPRRRHGAKGAGLGPHHRAQRADNPHARRVLTPIWGRRTISRSAAQRKRRARWAFRPA